MGSGAEQGECVWGSLQNSGRAKREMGRAEKGGGVKDRIRDQKVTGGGKPLPPPDFEEVVVRIIGEDSAIFDGLDG